MFIIEANIGGGKRVLTFESNLAAYYFFKNVSTFARADGGINNRKLIIKAESTDISYFDKIHVDKYYKDYKYNPNEHLIIVPYYRERENGGLFNRLEEVHEKLINEYKASLDRKIIDIDIINSCHKYVVCLITTE